MNSPNEPRNLYDVARQVCHEFGLDYTDPRTGKTEAAPEPPDRPPRRRRLLVEATLKEFALEYAATRRRLANGKPRFTRVSRDWCDHMEAQVKAQIRRCIDTLPSNGRTIT